jgi:hypothetical protein
MRAVGLTEYGLRRNLREWVDLSVKKKVPHSLLLMSSVFNLSERRNPEEEEISAKNLQATLSSLPQRTVAEALDDKAVQTDEERLEQ